MRGLRREEEVYRYLTAAHTPLDVVQARSPVELHRNLYDRFSHADLYYCAYALDQYE